MQKISNALWNGGRNMKPCCQILGIVGSQIEIKNIFSLTEILTNLKRCHLQLDNLEKWIFMNKNWLNDARMGCKALNNLVMLIDF
jgi:hypothetical protein